MPKEEALISKLCYQLVDGQRKREDEVYKEVRGQTCKMELVVVTVIVVEITIYTLNLFILY